MGRSESGGVRARARRGVHALVGAAVFGASLVAAAGWVEADTGEAWVRTQHIPLSGASSVDVDGNRMAVGVADGVGSGAVAVYERAGEQAPWLRVATIVPPDGVDLVRPSSRVDAALDGDRIVVRGMVPDDTPDPFDGPVHLFVYERDPSSGSWESTAQIAGVGTAAGVPQLSGDRLAMISREPTCPGLCADDHVEVFEHDAATDTWNRTLDRPTFNETLALDGSRLVLRDSFGFGLVLEDDPAGGGWVVVAGISGLPGERLSLDGDRVVFPGASTITVVERSPAGSWQPVATIPWPDDASTSLRQIDLDGDRFVFAATPNPDRPVPVVAYERALATGAWERVPRFPAPTGLGVFGLDLDGDTIAATVGPQLSPGSPGGSPDTVVVWGRGPLEDLDGDGVAGPDDPDDDGDGVVDEDDAFPTDPDESVDADGDGVGDNADPDDDNDGLPDGQDPAPTDPDADDDGIIDGRDVEHVQAVVAALPGSALTAPGHRSGIRAHLDQVETAVAAGDTAEAVRKLEALRGRMDGCGQQPDRTDWVADCAAQVELRGFLDVLLANLRAEA